jgi:D-3-phosphoglycerate dehydrogenase
MKSGECWCTIAKGYSCIKRRSCCNAVNLPTLNRENMAALKPYILALEKFGKIYFQLKNEAIESITVKYYGKLAAQETEMLTLAAVKGVLEPVLLDKVNYVNAKLIAEQRGITINEKKNEEPYAGYSEFVKISIKTKTDKFSIAGNVDSKGDAKILEIEGYSMDFTPSKYMLFIKNLDVPGVIGKLGTILGQEDINIATMQVGRDLETRKALMVMGIDNECSRESLDRISQLENITMAKLVIM